MTALLCIDTEKNRVRRYNTRREGGRLHVTDEVRILRPQCDTLMEQLEALRNGDPVQFADEPEPQAA